MGDRAERGVLSMLKHDCQSRNLTTRHRHHRSSGGRVYSAVLHRVDRAGKQPRRSPAAVIRAALAGSPLLGRLHGSLHEVSLAALIRRSAKACGEDVEFGGAGPAGARLDVVHGGEVHLQTLEQIALPCRPGRPWRGTRRPRRGPRRRSRSRARQWRRCGCGRSSCGRSCWKPCRTVRRRLFRQAWPFKRSGASGARKIEYLEVYAGERLDGQEVDPHDLFPCRCRRRPSSPRSATSRPGPRRGRPHADRPSRYGSADRSR